MKKILKKMLRETNWEPFLCVVGATVTSLSIILPIIPAIDRKNGWWLSLWAVTGPGCGLYWSVVKSFCDRNY